MFAAKIAKPGTNAVHDPKKHSALRPTRIASEDTSRGYNTHEADLARGPTSGASWDFSKLPLFSSTARPSVAMGQIADPLEQQADRVVDHVMRPPSGARGGTRQPASTFEAKPESAQPMGEASGIVGSVVRSPGQPLARDTRRFFEERFGQDFSSVQIHSDAAAAASAERVQAIAYTVGSHVVFGAGRYAPHDNGGKRLLAHELTHTIQQGATGRNPAISPPILQRQPKTPGQTPTNAPSSLVQKFLRGEATDAEKATLRQQLVSGQLSAADVDALKNSLEDQFRNALRKTLPALGGGASAGSTAPAQAGGGQISVTLGGDESADVHKFYKVGLHVRLSGAAKALAGGLEGTVETTAEVNAGKDPDTAVITIDPPQGDTALAANVRTQAFPKGPIVIPVEGWKASLLKSAKVGGTIRVTISGDKNASGGLVVFTSDLPAGVSLDISLSQSDTPFTLAAPTGASALPPSRAFLTTGGGSGGGKGVGAITVGLDVPLATDSKNPLLYGGIGLRAAADTRGSVSGTGALIVGAHLSPFTLQMAVEAGVVRDGADGKARAAFGAEGSISYKVLQHVEVMALASVIGGTSSQQAGRPAATLQGGVGVTF
jgi:hypothetical protein